MKQMKTQHEFRMAMRPVFYLKKKKQKPKNENSLDKCSQDKKLYDALGIVFFHYFIL